MRLSLFSAVLLVGSSSAYTCINDKAQKIFQSQGALAVALCKIIVDFKGYSPLPDFMEDYSSSSISSACACITATKTSSTSVKTSSTALCSATALTITSVSTSTVTAAPSIAYSTVVSTVLSTVSTCSVSSVSSTPSSTSTSTSSSESITSSSIPSSASSVPVPCTATLFSQVAPAIAACTAVTLLDIACPTNKTLPLTGLKNGQVITFAGTTTFAFTNISTFDPISISGVGFTIQGAPGHVIDGNGAIYWDGIGSNGGIPKPSHFIGMTKVTGGTNGVVIKDINIINYPVHCWSISASSNVLMTNIHLDNSAGNAPTAISNGLPGGHNSDGFDLSSCTNFTVQNSWVSNQDDCVAVTSGDNILIDNIYCTGGHGMSIGSVGGKSNNNVTNIVFSNSVILNSTNGPRIKTNYNTTGFINNITYRNIYIGDAQTYGIDIQQDYLNGGPTGSPTNGVIISDIFFHNVTGTAAAGAQDYYILCGDGSCSDFVYDGVSITGGTVPSSCNYPTTGCPGA